MLIKDPAKMKERIEVYARASGTGSFNEPNGAFTDEITTGGCWASWEELPGRELIKEGREINQREGMFFTRYRTDFTIQHRISWDSTWWDIQRIREVGHKQRLEIWVKEVEE
jgi:head-tail adaptor